MFNSLIFVISLNISMCLLIFHMEFDDFFGIGIWVLILDSDYFLGSLIISLGLWALLCDFGCFCATSAL